MIKAGFSTTIKFKPQFIKFSFINDNKIRPC